MEVSKLGIDLKKRRVSLSLKQEDIAEMSGTTIKTLHLIESGKGNPSLETLNKIINVLGLELILQIKQLG
jgi:transcriptional regulator with XRE-family HTH domain